MRPRRAELPPTSPLHRRLRSPEERDSSRRGRAPHGGQTLPRRRFASSSGANDRERSWSSWPPPPSAGCASRLSAETQRKEASRLVPFRDASVLPAVRWLGRDTHPEPCAPFLTGLVTDSAAPPL